MGLALADNVRTFPNDVPITITSLEPARLLAGTTAAASSSATVSLTLPAGSRYTSGFFVRALDGQGSAKLLITAAGFEDTYVDVPMRE